MLHIFALAGLFAVGKSVVVEPTASFSAAGFACSTPPAAYEASFTISVKQQNIDAIKQRALRSATPGASEYGQYLTNSEIAALTKPRREDMAAVTTWLRSSGAAFTIDRENVFVTASVEVASRLLETEFFACTHPSRTAPLVRAAAYNLPANVASSIDAIFGLHGLPLPAKPPLSSGDANDDAVPVTPAVIYSTYSVGSPYVDRSGKNSQAVAEFQQQYMSAEDLAAFFAAEVPSAQPGDEKVSKFVGAPYKNGTGIEADLDIQFIMGVAPGIHTEFWEWPQNDFCADLANYTSALLSPQTTAPAVNSISYAEMTGDWRVVSRQGLLMTAGTFATRYGWQGDLSQVGCAQSNIDVVDANWAKLAAAGISMLISSGDSGSGYISDSCSPASYKAGKTISGGTVQKGQENLGLDECCSSAAEGPEAAVAWTWVPPHSDAAADKAAAEKAATRRLAAHLADVQAARLAPADSADPPPPPAPIVLNHSVWHVALSLKDPIFEQTDVVILDGTIPPAGGSATLTSRHSARLVLSRAVFTPSQVDAAKVAAVCDQDADFDVFVRNWVAPWLGRLANRSSAPPPKPRVAWKLSSGVAYCRKKYVPAGPAGTRRETTEKLAGVAGLASTRKVLPREYERACTAMMQARW
jgi:hypothetical protein